MKQGIAIIIGAGPAGLTAAVELQRQTQIKPIVLEASHEIGGISRTVRYKGNRMDIGGHRLFSKSDRVMQWWLDMIPIENAGTVSTDDSAGTHDPHKEDLVMLVRERRSRIYFLRRFFHYPIRLSMDTLRKMGVVRAVLAGLSYLNSALVVQREEKSLEDFFINRFGMQLYRIFFKDYTEKVWGVPCSEISAEWGAQRIKGLSLAKVCSHFVRKVFHSQEGGIAQRETETSLIEKFLYPKLGPGQLWEQAAERVLQNGGEIHLGVSVDRVNWESSGGSDPGGGRIVSVEGLKDGGKRVRYTGDYFFSTMPVRDLVRDLVPAPPTEVSEVSEGLVYRDFITVGLLVDHLALREKDGSPLKDNWIYIQEPDVLLGRLQIFNNWSPWLVGQPGKMWLGLEYFCNETDPVWKLPDEQMARLAMCEVEQIGMLKVEDVEDWHVVHVAKTYPAYFGSYDRFDVIREYTDGLKNLFLVGRNGMHKYNNQDHSMLTAITAVENIANGVTTKDNIWAVNTESEYHEEKTDASAASGQQIRSPAPLPPAGLVILQASSTVSDSKAAPC